jgi:NRPS condensation-like uncharacterized protein
VESEDSLWWELLPFVHPRKYFSVLEKTGQEMDLPRALSQNIDPYEGPQVMVFLIRTREGTGDVLVINASHVAMDGRGLKDLTGLIMEFYYHSEKVSSFVTREKLNNYQYLPLVSTCLPYPYKSAKKDEISAGAGSWTFPVQSPETHNQSFAVMTIPVQRVATIHRTRKDLGVTLNDLILSVIAKASVNLMAGCDQRACSFLNTVDMRRYHPVSGRSVTNYSTAFEVRIPVKPTDSISDLCCIVHKIMENKKNDLPGIKEALDAELLWKSGVKAARETFRARISDPENYEARIPIFTNTGIIDLDRTNHCIPSVRNAWLLPCHAPPPAIFIAISTYRDTITISSTYHRPAVADEQVQSFYKWINLLLPGYSGEYGQARLQFIP